MLKECSRAMWFSRDDLDPRGRRSKQKALKYRSNGDACRLNAVLHKMSDPN